MAEPSLAVVAEGEPDQEHGDRQRRPLVDEAEALRQGLVGLDHEGAAGLGRQREGSADQRDQPDADAEGSAVDAGWARSHAVSR